MNLSNDDVRNIRDYYINNKMANHTIKDLKKFVIILLGLVMFDLLIYYVSFKQLKEIYSSYKNTYMILIVITLILSVAKYIFYFISIMGKNKKIYNLFISALLIQFGIMFNVAALINSEHEVISEKLINIQMILTIIGILYLIIRSINFALMIRKGSDSKIKKIRKIELITLGVIAALSIVALPSKYGQHSSVFGSEIASFGMGCFFWSISCLLFCFAAQCLVRYYYYSILDLD